MEDGRNYKATVIRRGIGWKMNDPGGNKIRHLSSFISTLLCRLLPGK
jgi:hypothetical protein